MAKKDLVINVIMTASDKASKGFEKLRRSSQTLSAELSRQTEYPVTVRGETGRRLGQCLSCAEKRAAYRSRRYVPPSEVNKFPPAPEILNHVYWPKYS